MEVEDEMEMEMEMEMVTVTEKVISGDDTLIEILVRTPVRSLLQFKTLSKRFYSICTNPSFLRLRKDRNRNIDPPVGLFLRLQDAAGQYPFVSFDTGNLIVTPPFTNLEIGRENPIDIMQSRYGLLLCCNKSDVFYVYNPTTSHFTILPFPEDDDEEEDADDDDLEGDELWLHCRREFRCRGHKTEVYSMNLDFDPSKSPHYKVACAKTARSHGGTFNDEELVQMLVYSSETRKWRVSGKPFGTDGFTHFGRGVWCNGAIHWPTTMPEVVEYFSFEKEEHHYFDFETPSTINRERHIDSLAESHDGMLLVGVFYSYIDQFDVIKMKKDYSGWFVMYHIDFDGILPPPSPEMGNCNGCPFHILSLDGGRNEGDLSIILQTPGQLLRYNVVPKTFLKLHDFVPGSLNIEACFQFIPSLSGV